MRYADACQGSPFGPRRAGSSKIPVTAHSNDGVDLHSGYGGGFGAGLDAGLGVDDGAVETERHGRGHGFLAFYEGFRIVPAYQIAKTVTAHGNATR